MGVKEKAIDPPPKKKKKKKILTSMSVVSSISGEMTETACEAKGTLPISCPAGEVINVINGFFGRTTRSICDKWYGGTWDLNCVSDTAPVMIPDLCDGQNSCDVPTTTSYYGDPCSFTELYVLVTYGCLRKYWYLYVSRHEGCRIIYVRS